MFDLERKCIEEVGIDKYNKGIDTFLSILDEALIDDIKNDVAIQI